MWRTANLLKYEDLTGQSATLPAKGYSLDIPLATIKSQDAAKPIWQPDI
jgi:hypothetical protein